MANKRGLAIATALWMLMAMRLGQAAEISSVLDSLSEPKTIATRIVPNSGDFTFEITFRYDGYFKADVAWPTGLLATYCSGYTEGWRIYFHGPDAQAVFAIGLPGGDNGQGSLGCPLRLEHGRWHRLAVSWQGDANGTGTSKMYVNGEFVAARHGLKAPIVRPGAKVLLGNAGYGLGALKVEIGEVRYGKRLTEAEIESAYASDVRCRTNAAIVVPPLFEGVLDRGKALLKGTAGNAKAPAYPATRNKVTGVGKPNWNNCLEEVVLARPDGKTLELARWPKKGYAATEFKNGIFRFDDPLSPIITPGTRLLARGYWRYLWQDETLPVEALRDGGFKVLRNHFYGFCEKPMVKLLNAVELATEPNEWYWRDGKVNFVDQLFEPTVLPSRRSMLDRHQREANLKFENIDYSDSLGIGLELDDCTNAVVANCTFRRIGNEGLVFRNCQQVTVRDCVFEDMGRGGLAFYNCGDRSRLEHAKIVVERCVFRRMGISRRCFTPGIYAEGCGMIIRNCVFEDLPSSGIRLEGNDIVVRDCKFLRTVLESDDQGAVDMWGNPSYRNCVFFNNVFCEVGRDNCPCGRAGIRFDDAISGMVVLSNVFDRCAAGNFGAVQIHGGHYNAIVDNEIIGTDYVITDTRWGVKRWHSFLDSGEVKRRTRGFETAPIYLQRYPELRRLREDESVQLIRGNRWYKKKEKK